MVRHFDVSLDELDDGTFTADVYGPGFVRSKREKSFSGNLEDVLSKVTAHLRNRVKEK